MSEYILEIKGLTKKYGKTVAVNDLDLTVAKGEVFGLLGPNGSGKTTTLGIILGAINPNNGVFSWFGKYNDARARIRVGSILEQPSFYHYLSAVDNLKVVCAIKGVREERIEEVLERVDLLDRKDDIFRTYSLGMKQRLAIASALISDPEVLILDEPTNGLDPQGIAEIRELIIELGKENRTIILASHLLDEVQRICSHFAVLKKGVKIFQGSVEEINAENTTVELRSPDTELLARALKNCDLAKHVGQDSHHFAVQLKENVSTAKFHKYLIDYGVVLEMLRPTPNKLEQKFLSVLRSNSGD